jgi:hypothetical protein
MEDDPNEKILRMLFAIRRENTLQNKMLKNHANPVDEYYGDQNPFDITQAPGGITIPAAFSSEVRIESIFVSLPVGITAATLRLGDRFIPLYNGVATTVQTILNIQGIGFILNGSDERFLTWTGTATTGYFIALNGHTAGREKLS